MHNISMERQNDRVERRECDVLKSHGNRYRGISHSRGLWDVTLDTLTSVATKVRVCGNLKWMSKKYLGSSY